MDGNKDEAVKCLKIAKDSIKLGDRIRALKFVNKARRLDPSIEIDDKLSNLNESPPDPSENGPRCLAETGRSSSSTSSSQTSARYTEEQLSIFREIKRKKDYYDILGLERSCSAEDIRKAYRKLSLKVHPDKNKAPGAEESFKMISKAFQCLSNEQSRKQYDLVGSEEPVHERRGAGMNGMQGFNGFYDNGFYDEDVVAEEIFRNFFFGEMHSVNTANFGGFSFGPRVRTGCTDHGPKWLRTLIQLLPVILILLLNFWPYSIPILD